MNGIHACKIKIKFIQSIILLFTNMSYFRFVYHDMFSIFRLSCLLLSTIGLAVLYVTFQGPNRSGHFQPSPSLRPLTEQELAFLRKPKWSHFRDRLKKLSFKQISRKRIRPEKANGYPILLTSWATNAIKVIHAISAAKSYHLNEKRKPSEYMHWIECVLVILNVYIVSWWIENIWIFTLIPECPMTVFSQYHFFKTRMQIYIYLYESCMRENWFAFTLGLKYIVVQSIDHLVILGNWSTRVWIKVYLNGIL